MDATLASALIQGGPVGLFALYLIWDRRQTAKERVKVDEEHNQLDRDRIEVDRHVAASLAALTAVIQQLAARNA